MAVNWVAEMEQDVLFHIEDEMHVECYYCWLIEHGECERMPESICSMHMSWLERKAQSLLVEPKKENLKS